MTTSYKLNSEKDFNEALTLAFSNGGITSSNKSERIVTIVNSMSAQFCKKLEARNINFIAKADD